MSSDPLALVLPAVLGRRLQEARKARRLTQQDVADVLGVARTTVTAIEKGERRVQPLELARLAEQLDVPVAELLRPAHASRVSLDTSAVELRATFDSYVTADAALGPLVFELERLCADYLELEQLAGISSRRPRPRSYTIDTDPEAAAEDAAQEERRRLGLGDGPVHDLRSILETEFGIRVFYMDLPSKTAAMFGFTEELGGCISVNRQHPAERRRLSLAHELGHFVCSRELPDVHRLGKGSRNAARERFANAFSYAFVMPEYGLRRRVREMTRSRDGRLTVADLCHLAHQYFVSVEAMTVRLEGLDLIAPGTWSRMKQGGFRVKDANEQLQLPPQSEEAELLPRRYMYLVAEAFGRRLIGEGEVARYLRMDLLEARRVVSRLSALEFEDTAEPVQLDLSRLLAPGS